MFLKPPQQRMVLHIRTRIFVVILKERAEQKSLLTFEKLSRSTKLNQCIAWH
jgi:hypothetical protein